MCMNIHLICDYKLIVIVCNSCMHRTSKPLLVLQNVVHLKFVYIVSLLNRYFINVFIRIFNLDSILKCACLLVACFILSV